MAVTTSKGIDENIQIPKPAENAKDHDITLQPRMLPRPNRPIQRGKVIKSQWSNTREKSKKKSTQNLEIKQEAEAEANNHQEKNHETLPMLPKHHVIQHTDKALTLAETSRDKQRQEKLTWQEKQIKKMYQKIKHPLT